LFTRAALSRGGRARKQFLISFISFTLRPRTQGSSRLATLNDAIPAGLETRTPYCALATETQTLERKLKAEG
jgi:hypothetical protein